MIKKLIIIVTASLWLLSSADTVFADFWRMVKPGQWSTYFGIPIKVKDVLTTQEIEKDGLFYYTYKLIIQRPGKDNGWGIAHIGSLNYRLYCWAATANINPYVTFFNDQEVYQDIHQTNERKIVVHLLQGLRPGKYTISVAVFPYPMIGDYSIRKMIQIYRGPYVSFLKDLIEAANSTNPQFTGIKILWSHAEDAIIDQALTRFANDFGEIIELEVLAKMLDLYLYDANSVAQKLKMRNLVP